MVKLIKLYQLCHKLNGFLVINSDLRVTAMYTQEVPALIYLYTE